MKTIGIDFGTGNSVLSSSDGHQVQVFQVPDFGQQIPSDILVTADGAVDPDPRHLDHPPADYKRVIAIKRHLLNSTAPETWERWLELAVARLRYLYDAFVASTHEPVIKAVLTCPANTGQAYRDVLMEIGGRLGLPGVDIVDEPTAAAVHHGLNETATFDERWLVVDWGCGTCDVSAITRREGQADLEVQAVRGENDLGGLDMDALLCDYLARRYGFDANLYTLPQVERLKIKLSSLESVTENLTVADGRSLSVTVTRKELETVVEPLLQRTQRLVREVLDEVHWDSVDEAILTGGPMWMPCVRASLSEAIDIEEEYLLWSDPLTSVAQGAAKLAELKRVGGVVVTNKVAQSIGIRVVQEGDNDFYHKIIKRGEARPVRRSVKLTTSADLQDVISIELREGDYGSASANRLLGSIDVVVRPENQGTVQMRLTFALTDSGGKEIFVEPIGDANSVRNVEVVGVRIGSHDKAHHARTNLVLGDPLQEFKQVTASDHFDPDAARQLYERLKIKYHPDRDPKKKDHWNTRLAMLDEALNEYQEEIRRRTRATTLPDLPWNQPDELERLIVDEMLAQRLTHCLANGIGHERRNQLVTMIRRYPDYRRVLASYLYGLGRNHILQNLLAADDRPHVGLVVLLQNLPDKPIRERHEVLKAAYRLDEDEVRKLLNDPSLEVERLYTLIPEKAPIAVNPMAGKSGGNQQNTPHQNSAQRRWRYEMQWTWVYGDVSGIEDHLRTLGFNHSAKRNAWYATERLDSSQLTFI